MGKNKTLKYKSAKTESPPDRTIVISGLTFTITRWLPNGTVKAAIHKDDRLSLYDMRRLIKKGQTVNAYGKQFEVTAIRVKGRVTLRVIGAYYVYPADSPISRDAPIYNKT